MMKNVLAGILLPILLALPLSAACAETPEERGFQKNEQLLREQQQQLKMQERERLLRELERSLFSIDRAEPEPKPEADEATDTCFEINQIELRGADNLLKSEKDKLVEPWLGKCMTLEDIDALRVEIDRYYIDKGWVMSRAYLLPGQNLKSGKLIFKVLEGTLDDIELNENTLGDRMQVATAFPGMKGEIIHIRDIEQGMDQLNRLQSNRASMNIEPVKDKPGYSGISIKNVPDNPYRLYFGHDNQGSESTGEERFKLTADIDNLLSLNDHIYMMATDYAGDSGDAIDNESLAVNVDIPYGYWTYAFGANYSKYTSIVDDPVTPFQISGESSGKSISISRVVDRGKTTKTSAAVILNHKETTTFLEDVKLESSSRKLTVLDMHLQHIVKGRASAWSFRGGYSRGLDLFGALLDEPGAGDDVPRAQFEKIHGDIFLTKQFEAISQNWTYRGTFSGQVSRDPLFGSEQIAMGGSNTVRGFRDSPVSGDSGVYSRNDLVWYAPESSSLLKGLSLTVGLDAGYARVKNGNIANTGKGDASLAGISMGASQSIRSAGDQQLDWSLSVGKPLHSPDFVEEDTVAFFDLSWKFW